MHYIPKKLYIKANAQTNAIVLDFEKSEHATYASHKWLVHKNYLGMHCIFFFQSQNAFYNQGIVLKYCLILLPAGMLHWQLRLQ